MKKAEGSITVFMALSMTIFFSAIFALLEAGRVSALKSNAEMCSLQAKDIQLSEYEPSLWEHYDLLLGKAGSSNSGSIIFSDAQNEQMQRVGGNFGASSSLGLDGNFYLLSLKLTSVKTEIYQLASDYGGLPFRKEAILAMQGRIPSDISENILSLLENKQDGDSENIESMADAALNLLKNNDGKGTANADDESPVKNTGDTAKINLGENPFIWKENVQKNGVLSFVMPADEISDKVAEKGLDLGQREIQAGSMPSEEAYPLDGKLLFHLYLNTYFSNALDKTGEHELDYEQEYLIAGKKSDRENLKIVVNRLILLRMVVNRAYLETDTGKKETADAVAAILSGLIGQPETKEAMKQGVLAVWAYAESVNDVKILLDGGKVSLVKTKEQWHTDILNLSDTSGDSGKRNNQNNQKGLSYDYYLQILFWAKSEEILAYRSMDIIEQNENLQMDRMISKMKCVYLYEAPPVFWDFVWLGKGSFDTYFFKNTKIISYY